MKHKGFTIVELIIVIIVIAILASITVIGYGAWRERSAKTEVMSDLNNAALAMNNYRNFNTNGQPPSSLGATGFKASPNVDVSMPINISSQFCVQASSKIKTSVVYYINSTTSKNPAIGSCPALPSPTTPVVQPGNIGYLYVTDCMYLSIDPPSGSVGVISYTYSYRDNGSAEWMPADSSGTFCSDSVTSSYLSYKTTGSLRIIANGDNGTQSLPLDIPYTFIENWDD